MLDDKLIKLSNNYNIKKRQSNVVANDDPYEIINFMSNSFFN